jgi:hypothetical protein
MIFGNGVATVEPTFVTKTLKNALCSVALLARAHLVFRQPLITLVNIGIKLGPLNLSRAAIPRRFRTSQHLRDTVSANPKIASELPPAPPILKMRTAHLQMRFHGGYPHALPSNERAKVADFYAARDNTMPPLPSPSIAPPITRKRAVSFSTASCRPAVKQSCRCSWNRLFSVESPTSESDAAWGLVRPLAVAMRTPSRRNSCVYLVAFLNLLHSKHCLKETGTKKWQNQRRNRK